MRSVIALSHTVCAPLYQNTPEYNHYHKVDRCLARYSPRAYTVLPNQLISEQVIGHIWAQMVPNKKTERNQSCLRIWGSYDTIESSPFEPQKWGLQGVA